MNTKDYVRIAHRIINIVFWMLIGFLCGDSGMGFYFSALIIYQILFIVIMGSMKDAVSKMVQVRNNRGFHSNSQKILRSAILTSVIVSLLVNGTFFFFGNELLDLLFGYTMPKSILVVFGVYFFLQSLATCYKGFYIGLGYDTAILLAESVYSIILIVSCVFVMKKMYIRGEAIAALLKNARFANLNGAIGAVWCQCAALLVSLIILIINFRKSLRIVENEATTIKGVDSHKSFFGNYIKISLSVIEEKLFPVLLFFSLTVIYLRGADALGVECGSIFTSLGVFAGKFLITVSCPFALFVDYVSKNKRKVRIDFNREEHTNLQSRVKYMFKNTIFMLLPISVAIIILAKPISMIFFAGKMALGATLLRQGGIVVLLAGICYVAKSVLRAIELDTYVLISTLVGYVASVLFLIPTVRTNVSISMMVWATVIYYLVQALILLFLVYRMIGINMYEIGLKAVKVIIASGLMAAVLAVLDKLFVMNVLIFIISIIVGALIYYISLAALRGISKKDITSLKGTLSYYPTLIVGSFFIER